jgi:hypothetical protein
MTILCNSGIGVSLWRVQIWACNRLMPVDYAFGDVRLAILGLVSHWLTAAGNAAFENIASRALQGARFARRLTAADTMVATGWR